MFNNVALDVFIGLVFIFLLYSLLATIVQEIIATRLAFRAKVLEKAIIRMLEDGKSTFGTSIYERLKAFGHLLGRPNLLKGKSIAPWFYAHPLIKYLGEDNTYSKPAYLSAQNFSKVIIDLLKGFGKIDTNETQTINDSINNETIYKLPIDVAADSRNRAVRAIIDQSGGTLINASDQVKINTDTALFLKSLWLESAGDVEKFKGKLENWFNDTMERCSGWYKRYTQVVLFILGLIVAVSFNVDTIAIHRVLSKDDHAREQLVQMAISKQQQYGEIIKSLDSAKKADATFATEDAINAANSSYNQTYQQLSNDAKEANSILGLGRPWCDTLKMCKDSTNRNSMLDKLQNDISGTNAKMKSIKDSIDRGAHDTATFDAATKTIKRSPTQNAKTDSSHFNTAIGKIGSWETEVKGLMTHSLSLQQKYDSIAFIEQRCKVIREQIGGRWFVYAPNQNGNLETLIGWLITALAICLGAPFWFDLLNKLISLRGAGTKIDASGSGSRGKASASSPGNMPPNTPIVINTNQTEEAVG
jgi:hypothetical protein